MGIQRLADLIRRHESVENNLHWCLDVSLGDDRYRVRKDHGPENLAALKRLTLGLVKRSLPPASTKLKTQRTSLKTRRLQCGINDDYLIKTLLGGHQDA